VRVVDYDKAGLVIVPIHEIGGLIASEHQPCSTK